MDPEALSAQIESPAPDVQAVLETVAERTRFAILRVLAPGGAKSVNELAAMAARPADQVSKHLRRMRRAGVLALTASAADGRQQLHEVPARFRATDPATGRAILDFGVVLLRF